MPKTKSKPQGLTVSQATGDARRIAEKIMPGLPAPELMVESRNSWDVEADVQTVTTTVSFPANPRKALAMEVALGNLAGWQRSRIDATRITIVRTVR